MDEKKSDANWCGFSRFFYDFSKSFYPWKKVEQQKQIENALKTAKTRLEVENEINQKSDADVRAALSDWLRDK
ncbi:hypothetical protein BVtw_10660 [Bartonella vinsonii subsp. berkhoffii str. Tweed]|uniref:Uncharacterized protein n=1 Tax=Bartonella vinsonii subsp. berkhoffii str. Tweed TaxID=1094502 RepID=N6UW65_BARVB|nr:hypothetical protein BVwin_11380 [Bartonella vinsonii subsp. berkhoffii str. Winnie]ENN94318.1 hypothetical protein BVtw_10660 [Bartonella vinsonii subsp. berkhoffii str. Tweed]